MKPETQPLLEVRNLIKHYPVHAGLFQRTIGWRHAVDGVTFQIPRGQTLGLVGESGCGKTTIARVILRLTPATSGGVAFDGQDVFSLRGSALRRLRRDMQIVFQDPVGSLDPRMRVGEIVGEGLRIHGLGDRAERG